MLQRKNLLLVEDDTIVLSALCQLLLASDEYIITKAKNCDDVHLFFKDNLIIGIFLLLVVCSFLDICSSILKKLNL